MSITTKLIGLGKKAKKALKNQIYGAVPVMISPVRRIERVATQERVCAMTFDDGPFDLPPSQGNQEKSLTLVLLETLEQYGAKGTFDIVGDTGENYPDTAGKQGTAAWGGVRYDHYPDFGKDDRGGAVHCQQLVERIISGGHQITNHGYQHILFGKKPFVYGKREHFSDISRVQQDLNRLHNLMEEKYGYNMTMSRPPHYVDKITNELNSYDAYGLMDYQYLAAAFDGAGWLPLSTYQAEVEATYRPLEELLKRDPNGLCGQIVFQKDGYNMARRTPVADGLPKQLELLKKYGYRVVTVDELMGITPFSDLAPTATAFAPAKALLTGGYCVAYSDNTVRCDKPMTRGELAMLFFGKRSVKSRIDSILRDKKAMIFPDVKVAHAYSGAIKTAVDTGVIELVDGKFSPDKIVTEQVLQAAISAHFGVETNQDTTNTISREQAIFAVAQAVTVPGKGR